MRWGKYLFVVRISVEHADALSEVRVPAGQRPALQRDAVIEA
jgi:hypothetical protein